MPEDCPAVLLILLSTAHCAHLRIVIVFHPPANARFKENNPHIVAEPIGGPDVALRPLKACIGMQTVVAPLRLHQGQCFL